LIFDLIRDNLVTYVFGSYLFLAIFIMVVFVVTLAAARVNVLLALVIGVPVFAGLFVSGWFGGYEWIKSLLVVIMGFVWGFVIWRVSE